MLITDQNQHGYHVLALTNASISLPLSFSLYLPYSLCLGLGNRTKAAELDKNHLGIALPDAQVANSKPEPRNPEP